MPTNQAELTKALRQIRRRPGEQSVADIQRIGRIAEQLALAKRPAAADDILAADRAVGRASVLLSQRGRKPAFAALIEIYSKGHTAPNDLVAAWTHADELRQESKQLKDAAKAKRAATRAEDDAFLRAQATAHGRMKVPQTPAADDIVLESESTSTRAFIARRLDLTPWVRHLYEPLTHRLLTSPDGLHWLESPADRNLKWQDRQKVAERAIIADAFDADPRAHWGQVRGALLKRLKDPRLSLLQRADFMALLDRARTAGKDAVVVGNMAFLWDESSGSWLLREATTSSASGPDGSKPAIWIEGKIISRNHGHLIVLPHIKSNGERVNGHTKNSPYQGPAELRSAPRELSFELVNAADYLAMWSHDGRIHLP
ncbi:hypothetical protein [Sphingosinicella sp. BN140058]|uniref:hypothetical protein n=1 Tax=Sphingosinicella sp. BN140058 TaxID=1892855 RepID=UPI001012D9D2|nr:hypothetical protein [Sphingosinicella sp. BN140058]QAY80449.1 hypothetical protein ETR14_27810 [Sphingosinicella sp. BN140058]